MINLRKFRYLTLTLALSLPLSAPVFVAGCAPGSTSASSLKAVFADAGLVVQGVSESYDSLKTLYPSLFSVAADAQVQIALASARDLVTGLSESSDALANATNLRGIESAVNQVLNIVAAAAKNVPGIPPSVLMALQAAVVLLPVIEAAANRLFPSAVSHVGASPARFRSEMTVGQARTALKR